MKKSILPIVLFLSLAFFSCSNTPEGFPKVVNVTKSDKLVRVKGSRLFADVPAEYKPVTSIVRYQKNPATYFVVLEIPNANFPEYKSKLSREEIEKQGAKVDIIENVSYNGFDGLYFEGPSKKPGETKIGLAFGDDSFATMLGGVCQTSDKSSIEELKRIFKNSYYDKSYKLDPLELVNFQLDETITGFKHAATVANVLVFSPNGRDDLNALQDNISSYQVITVEAGRFEKIVELLEMSNSKMSPEIKVSDIEKKETIINGNKAMEITFDTRDADNVEHKIFQAGIYNEATGAGVVFNGIDSDKGKYFEKLKATARSIKLLQ